MKRLVYLVVVLLLLPCRAYTDIQKGDQIISGNLGFTFPLSDIDFSNIGGGSAQAGGPGVAGGFQYLYHVNPTLAFGPDIHLSATGTKESASFLPPLSSEVSMQSAVFLAMLKANLVNKGRMIPYFFCGLGFHSTHMQIDIAPPSGFVWLDTNTPEGRPIIDSSAQGVAAAFGLGADAYLNQHLFLGLEARFNYLGNATYDSTALGLQSTGIQSIEGSFAQFDILTRIGFRFGGPSAAAAQTSPAAGVAASPAAAASGDPAIKEYVQANYRDLIRDLEAWQGPVLSELLNKLLIPEGERLDTAKKIKELSKQYPNIIEFADHVAMLKR